MYGRILSDCKQKMNLKTSRDLLVNKSVVRIKKLNIQICSQISDLSEEISTLRRDPFAELLLNSSLINEVKKRIEGEDDSYNIIAAW